MTVAVDKPTEPRVKRWTKQEYNDLVERGAFRDRRVYLYRGEIIQQFAEPAPQRKRWSKEEYNLLVEKGAFQNQNVFLFRGELIEMPPMGALHARALAKTSRIMYRWLNEEFLIRVQMPFDAPGSSMTEPDLAVYTEEAAERLPHPRAALLVIEVSDTSLSLDRAKAIEYAAAGVPDYWIEDVMARKLEVYRDPVADASSATGFRYGSHEVLSPEAVISPLVKPTLSVTVAELLG
jgi:Uma2 family endonuclease